MSLSPFSRGRWPVYRVRKSHIVLALALTSALFVWSSPPAKAFSQVGALTLNAGENRPSSAVIDSAAGFAYFGTSDLDDHSSASIIKIRLSDFSRVDALKLNAGENIVSAAAIDPDGGFGYFGTTDTRGSGNDATIVKVRLSDFTRAGSLTLGTTGCGGCENYIGAAVLDTAAGFGYFAVGYCEILRVRLSDLARMGVSYLPCRFIDYALFGVIDPAGGFAYFGTYSEGFLSKISLSDFTIVDTLQIGQCCFTSAVIDPPGGFVYFASALYVFKIYLSNFTIAQSPGYTCANCKEGSAVADTKAGIAYFAGPGSSTVSKVQLSDLAVFDEVNIGMGEVTSAAIDSSAGFAYFGSDSSPGTIYKVETSPTIVRTSAGYTFRIESNSIYKNFQYADSQRKIFITLTGMGAGASNITIPKAVLHSGERISVTLSSADKTIKDATGSSTTYHDTPVTPQLSQDANNYYLYLEYQQNFDNPRTPTNMITISFLNGSSPSSPSSLGSIFSSIFSLFSGAKLAIAGALGVFALIAGGIVLIRRVRGPTAFTETKASTMTLCDTATRGMTEPL